MFKILPWKIKSYFGIGIIFVLINVALTMIIPILISQFIPLLIHDDNAIAHSFDIKLFKNVVLYSSPERQSAINFLIITSLAAILIATLTSIISVLIIIWAGENASNFYRNTLFAKYQKLSLKDIANLTTESLITRINDDVAVFWDFLINASTALIKAPLFIIVGLVFAFSTDINFAWSIVGVVPVLIFVFLFIFIKTKPLINKNRHNLDKITKEAEETIIGARFIRAYNLQEKQKNKFFNINSTWKNVETKVWKIFIIGTPAFFGIINLVIVAIFIMAANLIQNGTSDPQLLAKINVFIEYEFIMALGIMIFANFIGSFIRAKISAKRITEVLNTKYDNLYVEGGYKITENIGELNDASKYSVEFKNLSYKYFDTSTDYAISDINFKIDGGKTLGIIGPTGSGKSTIANLIVNNMKYTNGNILINDKEVKEINTKELHQKVGIVYQEPLLYSGSIKSNMLFAKSNATETELERALETACALEFIKTFDDRLEHVIEQRGKNLSGGQKQRLSIARTLLNDPKILILDDSTSALDNITTKKLIENIKKNYDCTTIIISQKINSIKHADQILVMDRGKIIASGNHHQLLKTCDWYMQVNENQLKQ
ncbi:ABC transporter ATP-binding protein [Mycoplasma buteonis]|uniref:ABC transporter ATP-binding protein n=1 Tax=Mycoplasma buteonis TaxID=171280 RepID=UPI00316ADFCA